MNETDLKSALQAIYDDPAIGVTVYALVKGEPVAPIKLDIEADALGGLKDLFIGSLREKISNRPSLTVLELSSADDRLDAVYVYDLDDVPSELSSLEAVVAQDSIPLLDVSSCSLLEIKALLIEIGNNTHQVVLYKLLPPVNVFGKNNFFLKKNNTRLEKIDDEFLRISSGFQMLRVDGALVVMDLKALERSFGFHDVIKREATKGLMAIEGASIVENPDVLRELIDDVKYARRLTKIAKASPVLSANVPITAIVEFCKTFPRLAGRIRFNAAEDKIVLDTKVSKDLFIKLLMDDFLTSELTKFHYASLAKDKVDQEVEST